MKTFISICAACFCLAASATAGVPRELAGLPLVFERNSGQTDARVQYLSRGAGYNAFLEAGQAVFATAAGVLRMGFARGNPDVRITGEHELAAAANYLIGSEPAMWRTGVRLYGKVRYTDVYPGIDLVFYGNQGRLEFDFVVAPRRDVRTIRLRVSGASGARLTRDGDLALRLGQDEIVFRKPVAYQDKEDSRQEVACNFELAQNGEIAFQVGDYDRQAPLIIDPVLAYSTYLGGSSADFSLGIAADPHGHAYVTGYTLSINYPTTTGAWDRYCGSNAFCNFTRFDAFVTKLSPDGRSLIYSTYVGGSGDDRGYGIGLVASANGTYEPVISGYTGSTNFPVSANTAQGANGGRLDLFVTRLSADGRRLLYSTYLGGAGDDVTFATLSLDETGNAYVTGYTASTNFPVTPGAIQNSLRGPRDAFLTKVNLVSGPFVYSSYLGGGGEDEGRGTYAYQGQAYVTGYTASGDFPLTANAIDRRCCTNSVTGGIFRDAFVTAVLPQTGQLVYSTFLGGEWTEVARSIAADSTGIYVTGSTGSPDMPVTASAFQPVYGGGPEDGFVVKLNPQGTAILYASFVGGSGEDVSHDLALDPVGNLYLTGYTNSSDLPVANAIQAAHAGGRDAFVVKLRSGALALDYLTYFGGSQDDAGFAVAANATTAYVSGYTTSANFPLQTPYQRSNRGLADCFVMGLY
jgi:hypothetical protein